MKRWPNIWYRRALAIEAKNGLAVGIAGLSLLEHLPALPVAATQCRQKQVRVTDPAVILSFDLYLLFSRSILRRSFTTPSLVSFMQSPCGRPPGMLNCDSVLANFNIVNCEK
jgi:hypothetical protein